MTRLSSACLVETLFFLFRLSAGESVLGVQCAVMVKHSEEYSMGQDQAEL